jgi:cystathionine gamma-lyase
MMNSQQPEKEFKMNKQQQNDLATAESLGFETLAIHQEPGYKEKGQAIVPPLVMSTTFEQFAPGDFLGYEYGRSGNPTRDVLEQALASLENAKHALTFSSGLSALTTLSYLLKCGDHIVCLVLTIMIERKNFYYHPYNLYIY